MKKNAFLVILIFIGIELSKVMVVNAGVQVSFPVELKTAQWTGTLEDGSIINVQKIYEILAEHKKWIETNGKEGKKIELNNADLKKVFLENKDLRMAVFRNCDLSGILFHFL